MQPSGLEKTLKLCIVTLFILFCVRQIWNEATVLQRAGGVFSGFGGVLRALGKSAWLRFVLVDFIGGSLFAGLYIYLRRGVPFFGIPVSVVAVLCVLVGSFVPLLYIAVFLLGEETLRAIAPGVAVDDADEEEKWLQPRVVGGFFLAYFILCVILRVIEATQGGFMNGWRQLFANVYARTLIEAYCQGFLVTALLLVMFEGGNTWSALAWFIAVLVFGNITAYAYAFVTAWKAAKDGTSFRKVLLTPGNVAPSDGVSLTTSGQTAMYSSI